MKIDFHFDVDSNRNFRDVEDFSSRGEEKNFEISRERFERLSSLTIFPRVLSQHWPECFVNPVPRRFHLNFPEGRLVPGISKSIPPTLSMPFRRDFVRQRRENGSDVTKQMAFDR